ncbi:MAG: hypothetical protein Q9225_004791 [Loekoesia sp. 1 TL-2023]
MANGRSDAIQNAPYMQMASASGGRAMVPSYRFAAGWPHLSAAVTYGLGNSGLTAPDAPDWSAYTEPMMSNVHSMYPEISMRPNFALGQDSSWAQIPSQRGFPEDPMVNQGSLSSNQYQQYGFPMEDARAITSPINHIAQHGPDRNCYQPHLGSNQTRKGYERQGRAASRKPLPSGQTITHADPAAMPGQGGHMVLDNQDLSCLTSDNTHSASTVSSPASTGNSLALPTNTTPRRSKPPTSICPYPGCQTGFSGPTRDSRSNLKRHIKYQHIQREKVRCPKAGCNSEFTREDNLHQHLRNKHGDEHQPQRINAPRVGVASDHSLFSF